MPDFGALVISLDFELHWGVRDTCGPRGDYRRNLLGVRTAIPRILDIFEEFGIAATWATVGFLFAGSRAELERFSPVLRPRYNNPALDPYKEQLGQDEDDDPLHFAPGMIREIQRRPCQEIGSHTFSHYYCLEPGQDKAAFAADLESAVRIAEHSGVRLKSMVLPYNQVNPTYRDVLISHNIDVYRGTQTRWMYRSSEKSREGFWTRGARICDAYAPASGLNLCKWDELIEKDGLCNVRAGAFLRPYSPRLRAFDNLRVHRIAECLKAAALSKRIFHLWWHPHNFGKFPDENLGVLRAILAEYSYWKARAGMRSMNMQEIAILARQESPK